MTRFVVGYDRGHRWGKERGQRRSSPGRPQASERGGAVSRGKKDAAMTGKYPPPEVIIRRYPASQICDVVVVVRGQEMVLRCPSYSHAVKWAPGM
jgi:hypothetical protein